MDADMIRDMIASMTHQAESARVMADHYAAHGGKGGRVAGAKGFVKRAGVDTTYAAILERKAADAERALANLHRLAEHLGL